MLQIKNPHQKILQAMDILNKLGMPKAQQNPRTGLCLLALLNVTPKKTFQKSEQPLMGITPIMDFCSKFYHIDYKPNSRETIRRFSMHQLVQAGIVMYNPDDVTRATNSPKAVYQIAPDAYKLIKTYKTSLWNKEYIE
jgi:type II restriction enzyme